MKKGLVIGYMSGNFGDDLFFSILFKRYPFVEFYFFPPSVLLKRYKKTFRKYKNVKFYDNTQEFKEASLDIDYTKTDVNLFPLILKKAEEVDFYINIGGSIFMEKYTSVDDDRFKIKKAIGDKPSFILGCNFGPASKEFTKKYKEWFKKFDDICFRDKHSLEYFPDLKNCRVASDVALLTPIKKNLMIRKDNNVAISVYDLRRNKEYNKYYDNYIDYLVRLIKYLQEKKYTVNLFSFCELDGDLESINDIMKKLDKKERIRIINYTGDIDKFLLEWQKNKYVIGTRFHASILALRFNQSFIPISYNEKTDNYFKEIDDNIRVLQVNSLDKDNTSSLVFNNVIANYNPEVQFKVLDEYIGGKL